MTTTNQETQINDNQFALNFDEHSDLRNKLLTDVEKAKMVLIHLDHIKGESENDRNQIFSNLLKAACYFGLDLEKIDFHRQDT
jgi:hypothetical protein